MPRVAKEAETIIKSGKLPVSVSVLLYDTVIVIIIVSSVIVSSVIISSVIVSIILTS